jgi:hypothetical protein
MKTSLVLLSVFACACGSTSSSGLSTREIAAYYNVDIDNRAPSTTRVSAHYMHDLSEVSLDDGETVSFQTSRDAERALRYDGGFYVTEFPWTDRTDAVFTLTRKGERLVSQAKLLPSTTIHAPASLTYASGKVDVTWTNPTPNASVVFASHPCGGLATSTSLPKVADTGAASLTMKDLLLTATPSTPACVTVVMIRTLETPTTPEFESSSRIQVQRTDEFQVTVTP